MFISLGHTQSSLLRQARAESKGIFAVGKFDQLQTIQPYSALVVAFDQVVHSILAEDPDVFTKIRVDILNGVGLNGRVLTDIIPSLIKVIGEQPEAPNVTGIEAQVIIVEWMMPSEIFVVLADIISYPPYSLRFLL